MKIAGADLQAHAGVHGGENMEDYNADFLVMLESWQATVTYLSPRPDAVEPQDMEVARLLPSVRCYQAPRMRCLPPPWMTLYAIRDLLG